jgi:hypothetical protein
MTAGDPETLMAAWMRWEQAPSSQRAVDAKLDAITAAGLCCIATHVHIAGWRRDGYSVPDAIQAMFNTDRKEAA